MGYNTFNISGIHKIRYDNFEGTKTMTAEELIARTKANAKIIRGRLKKDKAKAYRLGN